MHIAVFGASGYTGANITVEALSRGHTVLAVSRRPAAPREGVEVRVGSVLAESDVSAVAGEVDALVIAVPAVSESGSLVDAVPQLIRASSTARLAVVGGAGSLLVAPGGPALYDTPDFPEAFREGSRAQGAVLAALREGGEAGDWFYLSPAGGYGKRNPGERTGSFRLGDDVLVTDGTGTSFISGADYAIAFVDELENPRHIRSRFTVGY